MASVSGLPVWVGIGTLDQDMKQILGDRVGGAPKRALIVVDVQNDFASPTGALYVLGGEDIIARVNQEVSAFLASGQVVTYTQDWHPPRTPHFRTDGGVWPVHCVRHTWGAELHPDLVVSGHVVRKGVSGEDGYSGFTVVDPVTGAKTPTALVTVLRGCGVTEVTVVGLATDYCVRATALDAVAAGFTTTVRGDAVGAVDVHPGDGDRALAEMDLAGVELA
ncbi:MAG: nicotinamidase/pyrazinamidase [Acidimicrobiaceae bacterium]|nr:nicotinamidase/pyrazinamidase [Acidimicrobiaceae bacterium]